MKAIILAAGYGRRMRPLTHSTHKTLLKINGKTIIEWMIDALISHRITDITLVTGYLANELKTFLKGTYPQLSFHYIHNERYAQTNNIFSMALAMEQITIDSDILLIECDLIFEPAVLKRLLASPYPNAALVDRYRTGMDGTVVNIGENQVITSVIPPHLQGETFDFADKYKTLNIYRFSKEFCQGDFSQLLSYYARTIDSNAYYELMLGILIYLQRNTIHAVVLQGEKWSEIDDPNDLAVAKFIFENQHRHQLLASAHGGFWNYDVLDFCYLRNMHFPTGAILSEIRNGLASLLQNYGSSQPVLNQKLAYFLLCDPGRVTVLNGVSQIYPFLQQQFKDSPVLIPTPTFGEYARIFPHAKTYKDHVGLDWPSLSQYLSQYLHQQVSPKPLVVFVNPNNPTGTTLSSQQLYQFAHDHPEATFCVDESFIDFSSETSLQPLLEARPLPNIFILKSLSKILGVPGIRLGYVYTTHAPFHQALTATLPIWNLNSLAENFLELLLKHRPAIAASFDKTKQDRDHLMAELSKLSIVDKVYPSGGNFLLVSFNCTQSELDHIVQKMISERQIYLKDVSSRFTDGKCYLRIAVRLPQEHRQLAAHLLEAANS